MTWTHELYWVGFSFLSLLYLQYIFENYFFNRQNHWWFLRPLWRFHSDLAHPHRGQQLCPLLQESTLEERGPSFWNIQMLRYLRWSRRRRSTSRRWQQTEGWPRSFSSSRSSFRSSKFWDSLFFRQWSHQQQQRLALLRSETDRQSQQIPSASGMYNLFATATSWKCIIAVLYEILGVSFINPDHLMLELK